MMAFEPLGPTARWKLIYALFETRDIDDIVTYEEMGDTLDLDRSKDRHTIQMAVRRAAKQYLRVNNRAVEAVPNVGYRVCAPAEHLRIAQSQQTRSKKALTRGNETVMHVDLKGLEPEVRKAFDVTARAFSALLEYNRRLDLKQRHLEKALGSVTTRQDRSDDELSELKTRLEKLETKEKSKQ